MAAHRTSTNPHLKPGRSRQWAMLEARGLKKTYGSVLAVSDVSFAIRPGEILGYIGPNGSGKSTTVKMLTGMIEPSAGEVLFNGHPTRDDLAAYKQQIGY